MGATTPPRCNFCGGEAFDGTPSRPHARCRGCGLLDRTRLYWMYLRRVPVDAGTRVLHVAPEQPLHTELKEWLTPDNHVTADIAPREFARVAPDCMRIDLCDLDDWPADEFDLILHSHVLEHTPCNIAYMLIHLHRMLKPQGRHICIIPFTGGCYDECFQHIGDEERHRRFGQRDHVRRFGNEDRARHLGSVVRLPERFDAAEEFGAEALAHAAIPESQYRGFGIATVHDFRKGDVLGARTAAEIAVAPDMGVQ